MEQTAGSEKVKTKEGLIGRVVFGRTLLISVAEQVPYANFDKPINSKGETVRKVLAHTIEWDLRSLSDARKVLAGKPVDFEPDEDNDAFNAKAYKEHEHDDIEVLFDQFAKTSSEVEIFLRSLTEQDLFRQSDQKFRDEIIYPGWFFDDEGHDSNHWGDILMSWKKLK